VTNFNQNTPVTCEVIIPADVINQMNIQDGSYTMKDQLYGKNTNKLQVVNGVGKFAIKITPSESFIYKL
jgi:hypothetical protein